MSGSEVLQVQPVPSASVDTLPLNASARAAAVTPGLSSLAGITATPCFVVLDDAWRGSGDLADVFEGMQQPCFGLQLLQVQWAFCCLGNRLNSHAAVWWCLHEMTHKALLMHEALCMWFVCPDMR